MYWSLNKRAGGQIIFIIIWILMLVCKNMKGMFNVYFSIIWSITQRQLYWGINNTEYMIILCKHLIKSCSLKIFDLHLKSSPKI